MIAWDREKTEVRDRFASVVQARLYFLSGLTKRSRFTKVKPIKDGSKLKLCLGVTSFPPDLSMYPNRPFFIAWQTKTAHY
jgi:hypothetical protein